MSGSGALTRRLAWLTWPWVLPAAILGGMLAWFIVFGMSLLTGGRFGFVLSPLSVGVAIYAFVRCGVLCAPLYKRAVALTLATFPLIIAVNFVLPYQATPETGPGGGLNDNVFQTLSDIAPPLNVPDRFYTLYTLCLIGLTVLGGVLAVASSWRDAEPRAERREITARAAKVRWIIFVPVALVLAAITYKLLAGSTQDPGYTLFLTTFTSAVFVLSATVLAPTRRRFVGACCAGAMVLAVVLLVILDYVHRRPMTLTQWALAVVPLGGALLGYLAALSVDDRPAAPAAASTVPTPAVSRMRIGMQWAFAAIVIYFAAFLALRVSTTWHSPQIFVPPVAWSSWPSIPPITPQAQRGHWIRDQHSIWLFIWPNAANDPVRTPKSVDQSHNAAYTNFKLESSRVIRICSGHPALMQSFKASWNGDFDAISEVYTNWGTTGYWAQYVRPASEPADPAAMHALQTLCGGQPVPPARPSPTSSR